jgi:hypothetical protein
MNFQQCEFIVKSFDGSFFLKWEQSRMPVFFTSCKRIVANERAFNIHYFRYNAPIKLYKFLIPC